MAALTSGSWTISFRNAFPLDSDRGKRKKRHELKLVLASGTAPVTLTLPGAGSVGMIRNLDVYVFEDSVITSGQSGVAGPLIFNYNATGNTIAFFRSILASLTGRTIQPLATTVTINSLTFYATAVGW